ncbi:MAG: hypothetical protein LUD03_05930 [Firmicutes bacterium]|nr:hypothetical protein [Bacillota bacterium]
MATFQNQATLSYGDNVINSNVVTGELVTVLSATKTAIKSTYTANSEAAYIVTLTNTGASDLTAVTITDDLGAYEIGGQTYRPLTYVDGSALVLTNGSVVQTPTVTADDSLVISGITVPALGSVTVYYAAAVNEYAPLTVGSSITNTAVITSDSITSPITVSSEITVSETANLTITKSLCPLSVSENGEITYTFTIQNFGNTAAGTEDNVTVTDMFSPILSDIAVLLDGTALTEPDGYTYSETTGAFATVPGVITVPAATFTQDESTNQWIITPGSAVLTVKGTV